MVFVALVAQASIAFSAPAAPLSRLLPELGKAAGVRLEVDAKLAREVVLIRTQGAPLGELTKRIARVTGGEWTRNGEAYRLVLSSGQDAKERRIEAVGRGEALATGIRQRQESRKKGAYADGGSGLIDGALAAIPTETLGSLGYKERVVFSTRPTAMQRPMPPGALRGMDLAKLPKPHPLGDLALPASGPVAVVFLALQTTNDEPGLMASLVAADAAGTVVGGETSQYWTWQGASLSEAERPAPPKPDAPLELSPATRALAASLAGARAGSGFDFAGEDDSRSRATMYSEADLSAKAAAPADALQPETKEPLGLVVGPMLAALAEGHTTSLVADIPDAAFDPAAEFASRPSSARAAVDAAWRTMGMDVVVEDGWTLVRPRRPAYARASRLDRAALGRALRIAAKDHVLSLDAQAEYAAAQPLLPSSSTFESTLFTLADLAIGKRIASSASGERRLLRVVHAMGGTLPKGPRAFGTLPPAVREALLNLVFNASNGPQLNFSYKVGEGQGTILLGGNAVSAPRLLEEERTVAWGRGIPADAAFSVEDSSETSIFGIAASGAHPRMSPHGGGYGMRSEAGKPMVVSTTMPRLDRYGKGTVRSLRLSLRAAPRLFFSRAFETESFDPASPTIGFDDLPAEIRKGIEDTEAGVRRMLEQFRGPSGAKPV